MTEIDESRLIIHQMPGFFEKKHYVGLFNRWDDGHHELIYIPVKLVEFVGDALTADDLEPVVMRVRYDTPDMPRGADGTCAYCHGDPCAERSPANSNIARCYAAFKACTWRHRDDWFTCPACNGRPT